MQVRASVSLAKFTSQVVPPPHRLLIMECRQCLSLSLEELDLSFVSAARGCSDVRALCFLMHQLMPHPLVQKKVLSKFARESFKFRNMT